MNTPLYSVINRQIKHTCTHMCMCAYVPLMHSTDSEFSQTDKWM